MHEFLTSLQIYLPKLVKQWWASVGLLSALVGLIIKLTGLAQPPTLFWIVAAVLTIAIANFQLFHSDRMAATEQLTERQGPALPYWVGVGLQGHRDATYLAVIGCSQDSKSSPPSGGDFPNLDRELTEVLGMPTVMPERRSFSSGFETTISGPQQITLRRAKVDITGAVFLQMEWRLDTEPVELATLLTRAVDGVRALRHGACAVALGKRPWIGIALIQWPTAGISCSGLITAQRWSDGDHRGQSVNLFSRLRRNYNDWSFVLEFAEQLLSDAGYIGHERELRALTEAQVRASTPSQAVRISPPTP